MERLTLGVSPSLAMRQLLCFLEFKLTFRVVAECPSLSANNWKKKEEENKCMYKKQDYEGYITLRCSIQPFCFSCYIRKHFGEIPIKICKHIKCREMRSYVNILKKLISCFNRKGNWVLHQINKEVQWFMIWTTP